MDDYDLKFLRGFLILYTLYFVNTHLGSISMLNKVPPFDAKVLAAVVKYKKSEFDTGVPALNELFRGLDFNGLCKELSLTLEDEENEAKKQ